MSVYVYHHTAAHAHMMYIIIEKNRLCWTGIYQGRYLGISKDFVLLISRQKQTVILRCFWQVLKCIYCAKVSKMLLKTGKQPEWLSWGE